MSEPSFRGQWSVLAAGHDGAVDATKQGWMECEHGSIKDD